MVYNIKHGLRPPRPMDPSQNQWLQDPVWDAIMACWNRDPADRFKPSVVYNIFSMTSPQGVQNVESDKPGDLNVQNRRIPRWLKGFRHQNRATAACKFPPTDRFSLPVSAGFGARNREAR